MTQKEIIEMIKSGTRLVHRKYSNGHMQAFLSTPQPWYETGQDCGTSFVDAPNYRAQGWTTRHVTTKIRDKQVDKTIWLLTCSSMHEMTVTEKGECVETIHSWKQTINQ